MLINFDEENFTDKIVKEFIEEHIKYDIDVHIDDICDAVFEDIEEWFTNYGLHTELVEVIIKKLEEKNIEIM